LVRRSILGLIFIASLAVPVSNPPQTQTEMYPLFQCDTRAWNTLESFFNPSVDKGREFLLIGSLCGAPTCFAAHSGIALLETLVLYRVYPEGILLSRKPVSRDRLALLSLGLLFDN
jgi:hypothetical protein